MTEKTFDATDGQLDDVMGWIEEELDSYDCPMKLSMQILVCVEEMFVNVAHYAYGTEVGSVNVATDFKDGEYSVTFTDSGIPFDPLAKSDPDITLSADERKIGGLGIFMVKKSMDAVSYKRNDGKNIFTMSKRIS